MDKVISLLTVTAVLLVIFAVLYHQGYMVFKSISSVSFLGSARGNSARFTSCNGFIKRVIRFKSDGTYTYLLDADVSRGEVSVELLDSDKQRIMLLDGTNRSASVTVEKKKKYCLVITFRSATGRYALIRA